MSNVQLQLPLLAMYIYTEKKDVYKNHDGYMYCMPQMLYNVVLDVRYVYSYIAISYNDDRSQNNVEGYNMQLYVYILQYLTD